MWLFEEAVKHVDCILSVHPSVQEGGTTGKGRPQKGSGTDEDIYGGVDDGAEGVYDNAGGQRGMKFSDEGVYENPRSTGECTVKSV